MRVALNTRVEVALTGVLESFQRIRERGHLVYESTYMLNEMLRYCSNVVHANQVPINVETTLRFFERRFEEIATAA